MPLTIYIQTFQDLLYSLRPHSKILPAYLRRILQHYLCRLPQLSNQITTLSYHSQALIPPRGRLLLAHCLSFNRIKLQNHHNRRWTRLPIYLPQLYHRLHILPIPTNLKSLTHHPPHHSSTSPHRNLRRHKRRLHLHHSK